MCSQSSRLSTNRRYAGSARWATKPPHAFLVQELFFRYGGINAESTEYRKAAANRVGVTVPEKIPLREFDKSQYFRQ